MHLQQRWPDLLPDLLRDISSRLHHAIDFVRFHTVCRPWRDSHDPTATTQPFLPWLLSTKRTKPFDIEIESWRRQGKLPNMKDHDAHKLTCVFSKRSYRSPPLPECPNWVADDDGTALRYLGDHPYSSLHNFLTGDTSLMPTIPGGKDMFRHPRGVVYRDGTILMYNKLYSFGDDGDNATRFGAALLHPGDDTAWTVVERTLEAYQYGKFCVTYHNGKILVSVGPSHWHAIAVNNDVASDTLIPNPWTSAQREEYYYKSGHIMESHGELLWASLHIKENFRDGGQDNICNLVQALSLSVYTLQEEMSAPKKKMRWVKKDSQSLADRVMFLGWSNSFALDASRSGCDGGCAYFIHSDGEERLHEWCAVFRYNLMDNKAEFVEWLPQGWEHDKCVWLIPQTIIAPVHACTMQL